MLFAGWVGAPLLMGILGLSPFQEAPDQEVIREPVHAPVILVPGWLGRSRDMMALKERLVRDGWPEDRVFPIEFDDPVGSSFDHAVELAAIIRDALRETGASSVDIIAHSMGGLAVWALLQEQGDELPIDRTVFMGTPFLGTVTAYLAWGDGGPEMIPGSPFLRNLAEGGWPQRWARTLAIRTPLDLTVIPTEGPSDLGVEHQVVCCPTHQGLLDHEETFAVVRRFLEPEKEGGADGRRFNEPM